MKVIERKGEYVWENVLNENESVLYAERSE